MEGGGPPLAKLRSDCPWCAIDANEHKGLFLPFAIKTTTLEYKQGQEWWVNYGIKHTWQWWFKIVS
ncbi:hypothetical protein CAI16_15010 [Virgibacillus dokdonensis]|uniref:Uncharacterized protein n=1 Tax=Virgibacillus dokdonensis TaxID=302167 RepID=A0A3E0WKA0_9BACI|nr:hypothetical protein CAI16_15010 [Virgibacillus dokdonensis]